MNLVFQQRIPNGTSFRCITGMTPILESRVQPRDGSAIQWLQSNGKDTSDRVCRALFDGEVDAIGVTEAQLALLSANHEVKRLFENPREVEANYFRKTKILPIMHVMALKKGLSRETSGIASRTVSPFLRVQALGATLAPRDSEPRGSLAKPKSRGRAKALCHRPVGVRAGGKPSCAR